MVEGFIRPNEEKSDNDRNTNNISVGEEKMGIMEKARSLECYFKASEVLAKHDEKYMPAEVAAALDKNKKLLSSEEEKNKKGGEEGVVNAASN